MKRKYGKKLAIAIVSGGLLLSGGFTTTLAPSSVFAQEYSVYDVIDAVNGLFEDDDPVNTIKETTDVSQYVAVKASVERLSAGGLKTDLLKKLTKASTLIKPTFTATSYEEGQTHLSGKAIPNTNVEINITMPGSGYVFHATSDGNGDWSISSVSQLLIGRTLYVKTAVNGVIQYSYSNIVVSPTRTIVNKLFQGNDPNNAIKDTADVTQYISAKARVDRLQEDALKNELRTTLVKASTLIKPTITSTAHEGQTFLYGQAIPNTNVEINITMPGRGYVFHAISDSTGDWTVENVSELVVGRTLYVKTTINGVIQYSYATITPN
ncbi:toxin Cry1Ac domain D-VI-related protein [Listeria grandensis]|uniref:toxin Cry1Ac domain D-VI-related protein n=1 Tax=Listeria grandensis TaxID=1494963 RepID=UPI00164CF0B9|nr:toxin Cry1Ac domain D-VI-related protein [Listeria grandensis]MBC6315070.1 hypothetical protein [Listeria grandensis]